MAEKSSMGKIGKISGHPAGNGTIDTGKIYDVHRQIRSIVEAYRETNLEVSQITERLQNNWLGKGRNEFEAQYRLLIRRIEDFGDVLLEIYNGLVEAEAAYEDTDDDIRQDFVMAMEAF